MDPVTAVTVLLLTSLIGHGLRDIANDVGAQIRGKAPPSHERWLKRHEQRVARGENPNPTPRYLERIVGNAVERMAEKSDARQQNRLRDIRENEPHRSEKRTRRKQKLTEAIDKAMHRLANQAGVHVQRLRDKYEDRKEAEAWRRNWEESERQHGEREQPDDPAATTTDPESTGEPTPDAQAPQDEVTAGEGATVLPFRPRATDDDNGETSKDGDTTSDDGNDTDEQEDTPVDNTRDEHELVTNPYYRRGIDPAENSHISVAELRRRWDAEDAGKQRAHEQEMARIQREQQEPAEGEGGGGEPANEPERPVSDIPVAPSRQDVAPTDIPANTEGATAMSNPTHPGEITNLTDAQNYCEAVNGWIGQVNGALEQNVSEVKKAFEQVEAEQRSAEQASASLQAQNMQSGKLDNANEQFAVAREALREAEQALAKVPDALASAKGAYGVALNAFRSQTGVAEQMQAAEQSAVGAAQNKDFYLNG